MPYFADDTAVTGVLPLDVEGVHIAHSDLWAAIDEPLRSKVKRYQIESSRLKLGECIGVGTQIYLFYIIRRILPIKYMPKINKLN